MDAKTNLTGQGRPAAASQRRGTLHNLANDRGEAMRHNAGLFLQWYVLSMDQWLEFIGNHPWLSGAFVFLLLALIGTEVTRRMRRYSEVSPAEATRLINRSNAVMLDVRSEHEFQESHIPNARHIPLDRLDEPSKALKRLKGKPVVVYCTVGPRSIKAAAKLNQAGMESVHVLSGGIRAWQAENLPVARGKD